MLVHFDNRIASSGWTKDKDGGGWPAFLPWLGCSNLSPLREGSILSDSDTCSHDHLLGVKNNLSKFLSEHDKTRDSQPDNAL